MNTLILLMAEILHQLIGSLSHHLQGFIHHRWCRISSINSSDSSFQPKKCSLCWDGFHRGPLQTTWGPPWPDSPEIPWDVQTSRSDSVETDVVGWIKQWHQKKRHFQKKTRGPKFQGDCFRVKCCFKTFRVNMGEQVKCSWFQNFPGEHMINLVSKNYELRKFVPRLDD